MVARSLGSLGSLGSLALSRSLSLVGTRARASPTRARTDSADSSDRPPRRRPRRPPSVVVVTSSSRGKLEDFLRCEVCGAKRGRVEPFRDLALAVRGSRTLRGALEAFTAAEQVSRSRNVL